MKQFLRRSCADQESKQKISKNTGEEDELLPITDDRVFKAMFTANNDDSRAALRSLLSACTHREIRDVQITKNELIPAHLDAKVPRLDVNVTFNDGEMANLEMQVHRSDDNLKDRAAYLAGMLQASQKSKGRKYREIKRVYQIFFLNCELFPHSDKLPRRYSYREEAEHDRLTEMTEIILYEMPKLRKKVHQILAGTLDINDLLEDEKWCIFMRYRHEQKASALIKQLLKKEDGIMQAERAVKNGISRSYRSAIKRMIRIKYEMDREQYKDDLKAEGNAEGQSEKALEIARKMKDAGKPETEIAEFTGLSFETIAQL